MEITSEEAINRWFTVQSWWFANAAARRQCPSVHSVSSGLLQLSRGRLPSRQMDVHGVFRRRYLHHPVGHGKSLTQRLIN